MNINILESNNKFSFDIRENGKCIFSSSRDSITTSFLKSHYSRSWEACAAARKLVEKYPFHIMHRTAYETYDASSGYAEGEGVSTTEKSVSDLLEENYNKILGNISAQLRQPSKEDKEIFHMSLSSFIIELTNLYQSNIKLGKKEESTIALSLLKKFKKLLRSKFGGKMAKVDVQALNQQLNPQQEGGGGGGIPGMASRKTLIVTAAGNIIEHEVDSETIRELLEDYAQASCLAIESTNNVTYNIEVGEDNCYIHIFNLCGSGDVEKIISIRINKLFHVDSIVPTGKMSKIYPHHSLQFYQKYWKPIVDNIGHFYLQDTDSLILSGKNEMPDLPKNEKSYPLEAWDVSDRSLETIDISFKGGEIWYFEKNPLLKEASSENTSRYSEQDYLNAMVRCIDKNQPNLFGEVGQVVQVIPLEDIIEVDVKFITFADEDNKIKKDEDEENIEGLVVRMSEDQIAILDDSQLSSMTLGI